MDRVVMPTGGDLFQEGGFWKLRWSEYRVNSMGKRDARSGNLMPIGRTSGPESLTEVEAREFAKDYLRTLHQRNAEARRSLMTMSQFVESVFIPQYVAPKKLAVRVNYRANLKHVIAPGQVERAFQGENGKQDAQLKPLQDWPYLGSMRLRDIRVDHVQQLIWAASARGYSPKTVNQIRSVVSVVFSFARQERYFTGDNPARLATLPEKVQKNVPPLTMGQLKNALRLMRYPEKEMTLIALLTDMNIVEICGLQWKHVNLTGAWSDSDTGSIPPLTIAVRSKWYRGEMSDVGESRKRELQIPELLLPVFLRLRGRERFVGSEDFVLASRLGTPISEINIKIRRLSAIGEELQMPGLSWNMFRRAHLALKTEFGSNLQFHMAMAI